MTTTRTHCIVCFNCQYISDPMSEARASKLRNTLNVSTVDNCTNDRHDVEVFTVEAGGVACMGFDDDNYDWDNIMGDGPF